MKIKKFRLSIIVLFSLLLMGCGPHSITSNVGVLKPNNGLEIDLGTISSHQGNVYTDLSFSNASEEHLYIHRAESSCDCVEGRVLVKGRSYPLATIETLITEKIIIGPNYSEIKVHIDYDPSHQKVGNIDEKITLYTSSRIDGEVVKPFNEKYSFTEIPIKGEVIE